MMIIRNVLIIAVKNLCITKLLDAEDMTSSHTWLSTSTPSPLGGKALGNIVFKIKN